MFGEQAYPDIVDKAAAPLQSLAINHPLFDGNERTARLSCVTFPAMNGVDLRPDIDAAERLVIAVDTGEMGEVRAISQGLRDLVVEGCESRRNYVRGGAVRDGSHPAPR